MDVDRVILDARVVDSRGQPLLGLAAGDFRVTVDGREVPLESAQWVAAGADAAASFESGAVARQIVLLVQKDLDPSRAPGMLKMIDRVGEMAGRLGPRDRVAVASFDSRLRLWTDFTTDRALVEAGLRAVLFGGPPAPPRGTPSLAGHLDPGEAAAAASPEDAILVLARALRLVPGPKTLVLIGHGFAGVDDVARRMLEDARAPVFALDVTDADAHSLEGGLRKVAEETGGFYARTHVFPDQAVARLENALAGHYVLTFPRPVLPVGEHAVEIRLVGRKGTVLAKRAYRG